MSEILKTNNSNCADCYKCIRYCPVNAIDYSNNQAINNAERCILDGKCFTVCPQKAKFIRNDVQKVKQALASGVYLVASVAPAFHSYYDAPLNGRIIAGLKRIGFKRVEQTSKSAYAVSLAHYKYYRRSENPVISSACPAVVSLVEKYYPELLHMLAPVVSPVIAHHRMLQAEINKPFNTVFIGPCIAKKKEAQSNDMFCLTFDEMEQLLFDNGHNVLKDDYDFFDDSYSRILSRYPLVSGLIKAFDFAQKDFDSEIITISGIDKIISLFNQLKEQKIRPGFIEALSCEGGCIMGPARPSRHKDSGYYELRQTLMTQISSFEQDTFEDYDCSKLKRTFNDKSIFYSEPDSQEIKDVLASIGKFSSQDELNCGSCGYDTCRQKAVAVIRGIAQKEMCIPYMKVQAEKFSDVILEASPNGVLILDNDFKVTEVNRTFLKISGMTKEQLFGKKITDVFGEECLFNDITFDNTDGTHKSVVKFKDKKLKKIIYSVPEQNLYFVSLIDITDLEVQKTALNMIKRESLESAKAVVEKQMKVAQEIALLLGETTVETKLLLGRLMKIIESE